jgi:hypothetical protein
MVIGIAVGVLALLMVMCSIVVLRRRSRSRG